MGEVIIDSENEKKKLCPCCSRSIERYEFKLCTNINTLSVLGPGFPLYFAFIKNCILILAILLFSTGLYNIISNEYGTDCI